MSVFTKVEPAQLNEFLLGYDLGKLLDYQPIEAGISNSNYFLFTDSKVNGGRFVLTLYEQHQDMNIDLEYILGLQDYLSAKNLACSFALPDKQGRLYSTLNKRPTAINHRVAGKVIKNPSLNQCHRVGIELARFHQYGKGFSQHRENPCGLNWLINMQQKLAKELNFEDLKLVQKTIADYRSLPTKDLPAGPIHADLFHDNVLYQESGFGGIIDFDFACNDFFILDIAISLNDWCFDIAGNIDQTRVDSMLEGYQSIRKLTAIEIEAKALMLTFAALRFWLSRLYDLSFPKKGELTFIKDPQQYKNILKYHQKFLVDL